TPRPAILPARPEAAPVHHRRARPVAPTRLRWERVRWRKDRVRAGRRCSRCVSPGLPHDRGAWGHRARCVWSASVVYLLVQPRTRLHPVSLDRPFGHSEYVRYLTLAEPRKETVLDHGTQPWCDFLQP